MNQRLLLHQRTASHIHQEDPVSTLSHFLYATPLPVCYPTSCMLSHFLYATPLPVCYPTSCMLSLLLNAIPLPVCYNHPTSYPLPDYQPSSPTIELHSLAIRRTSYPISCMPLPPPPTLCIPTPAFPPKSCIHWQLFHFLVKKSESNYLRPYQVISLFLIKIRVDLGHILRKKTTHFTICFSPSYRKEMT